MVDYTELTTRLDKTDSKGISLREYLQQAKKAGADPEELKNIPELGFYTKRLWGIFVEIRASNPVGFNGPLPMSHSSLRDLLRNTGIKLNKRDLKILEVMDRCYLKELNSE